MTYIRGLMVIKIDNLFARDAWVNWAMKNPAISLAVTFHFLFFISCFSPPWASIHNDAGQQFENLMSQLINFWSMLSRCWLSINLRWGHPTVGFISVMILWHGKAFPIIGHLWRESSMYHRRIPFTKDQGCGRDQSRCAPNQWETSLHYNEVSN